MPNCFVIIKIQLIQAKENITGDYYGVVRTSLLKISPISLIINRKI